MSSATGEIVLHRSKAFRDRFRKYKVVVDGEEVGHIKAGEVRAFPVPPGDHQLRLKIDWKGSPVVELSIATGERLHFACGGRPMPNNAIFELAGPSDNWVHLELMDPQP